VSFDWNAIRGAAYIWLQMRLNSIAWLGVRQPAQHGRVAGQDSSGAGGSHTSGSLACTGNVWTVLVVTSSTYTVPRPPELLYCLTNFVVAEPDGSTSWVPVPAIGHDNEPAIATNFCSQYISHVSQMSAVGLPSDRGREDRVPLSAACALHSILRTGCVGVAVVLQYRPAIVRSDRSCEFRRGGVEVQTRGLDISIKWRWEVSVTLRHPLERRLGEPTSRSGRYGEVKILDSTGTRALNPPSFSP
jgi:hypothetical protein